MTALTVGLSTVSRTVCAEPPAAAGAAELLDAQGTSLMQDHRYVEACPKLAESDRLKPGTGVLLRLALCYELSHKTASAWSTFREAARRAQRAGDESLADLATRHAETLEPRVAKLIVQLVPETAGARASIRLDGVLLASPVLGVGVPIDPGQHTIEAEVGSDAPVSRTFTVADQGGTTAVALDVTPAKAGSQQRIAATAVGGIGLVGLAAGSILGIMAMSNWNRARSECANGTSGCSSEALDLEPVVRNEALGSTIAFAVGGGAILGAALLWWTAPAAGSGRRGGVFVTPSAGSRELGACLTGRF
jgi:hypothetical protein